MNRFFKFYIVFLITILSMRIFYAQADEPIKMARFPAPSPDGKSLIFSYQGDLWRVSIDGGQAVRLTVHQADDSHPVWSPDGNEIAFSSNRFGNDDIYVMPPNGGTPERITFFLAATASAIGHLMGILFSLPPTVIFITIACQ